MSGSKKLKIEQDASKGKPEIEQMKLSLVPERQIFQIAELNAAIQGLFGQWFTQIWVAGEISGCRMAASGHYYFGLRDADSQLKCVLFKSTGRFARVKPKDGLAVLLQGSLEVYSPRGEYQFIVERLDLQGSGALQVAFEAMKSRLAAEGLFRQDRKKALPRFPQRIGLITSPGGAVLHDLLHVLGRRFPGLHIRLYPSQVQGEGSAEQLCSGIEYFSDSCWAEVVILARGGGSLEDLWSFNDESLARAIAACRIPVISAVGHETDFTIADFVADCRAPTPSAAAEIVVCTKEVLSSQFEDLSSRLVRGLRYTLALLSKEVSVRTGDGGNAVMRRVITRRMQQVDEADQRLARAQQKYLELLNRKLGELRRRLQETNLPLRLLRNKHRHEVLLEQLAKAWRGVYWRYDQRLVAATSHVVQLSPLAVLERGYAIVENASHKVIRSATETAENEELLIRLHAGKVRAVVTEIETSRDFCIL